MRGRRTSAARPAPWVAATLLALALAGRSDLVARAAPTDAPAQAKRPADPSDVATGRPGPHAKDVDLARGPRARPVVVDAIGDSITAGYARSGDSAGRHAEFDPGGGYPGRVRALLDDATVVRQRGAGGSTLATWTAEPRGAPADLEALLRSLWPDLPRASRPPRPRQNALSWTIEVDRPDVVILLLGVNDLWLDALSGGPPDARGAAARVAHAAATVRASGARVLVATLLPNRRDPEGALEEFNRRLCELETDCVRLDREFVRAGGLELLGDEVHPSPEGHRAIAVAIADALVGRGISHRRVPSTDGIGSPGQADGGPPGADPVSGAR